MANHLRIVRELAGLSPEQTALKSGGKLSASYVRRLEKGKNSPTIEALVHFCKACGIDVAKFFSSMLNGEGRKTA